MMTTEMQWHTLSISERMVRARQMLEQLREVYCDLTLEDRVAAKREMLALSEMIVGLGD